MIAVWFERMRTPWSAARRREWRASLPRLLGVQVSGSSSLGWVAAAIGPGPLGIDIEAPERWPLACVALGIEDASDAVRRWVRLEALLKATGRGLGDGIDARLIGRLARPGLVDHARQRWIISDVPHPYLAVAVASAPGQDVNITSNPCS